MTTSGLVTFTGSTAAGRSIMSAAGNELEWSTARCWR